MNELDIISSNSHVKSNFQPIMETEIKIPLILTDINVYPLPNELEAVVSRINILDILLIYYILLKYT